MGSEREFRYEIAKEQKQGIQVSVRRTDKKLKNNKKLQDSYIHQYRLSSTIEP